MGDLFASYMVEEEILEHNLYGVDINEDAVEIAKLSLWLRTAKRGRPLTKLVDKIKCGNSLIDDSSFLSRTLLLFCLSFLACYFLGDGINNKSIIL